MATFHDLDAEVARRVMGDLPERQVNGRWRLVGGKPVRPYTTDIAAAWQIVEHLRRQDWCVEIFAYPDNMDGGWWCSIDRPTSSVRRYQASNVESSMLAICRAALTLIDQEDAANKAG